MLQLKSRRCIVAILTANTIKTPPAFFVAWYTPLHLYRLPSVPSGPPIDCLYPSTVVKPSAVAAVCADPAAASYPWYPAADHTPAADTQHGCSPPVHLLPTVIAVRTVYAIPVRIVFIEQRSTVSTLHFPGRGARLQPRPILTGHTPRV